MSIKGLLVSKLQDSFGQYIEGLTADNLKMQVWAGVITQENLSLKREALAALNLPISVSAGFLGKFKVSVPWTNLGTQSVVVEIEDVSAASPICRTRAATAPCPNCATLCCT